jgi:DNA-binding response OmpR family regulator
MEGKDSEEMDHPEVLSMGVDLDQVDGLERQRILVIDDEVDTIYLLKQILRIAGYNVLSATNGEEAIKKTMEYSPNLILLDIMMPEMDGWETFDYLKRMTNVPIIILSAIGEKEKVVEGLRLGVDDYITKPFFNAEVVERIRAVLRRTNRPQEITKLVFPAVNLAIDLINQEVELMGKSIRLTPKEFSVLSVLAKSAPGIVPYEKISTLVWNEDSPDVRKRTKYLVYLLRRKFDKILPGSQIILNVDRLGYKLQTEEKTSS